MKKLIIGFFAGSILASACCCAYIYFIKSKQALGACAFYSGEPEFAHDLFSLADSRSDEARLKAMRTSAHIIKSWICLVNITDEDYPFLNVKERLEDEYQKASKMLSQYETAISNKAIQAKNASAF